MICMAEPFSVERRRLMRMLGAKVIVTPKAGKGTGMVRKAEELCAKHGWFLCHQFENEANWKFHEATTGPEILTDFSGKRLDYWVTGYGTGGTFNGAGRAIKKKRPDVKIILAEPEDAGLLASGIATERNADGSPAASHPAFKPHPIQGWTPDFIPKVRTFRRVATLAHMSWLAFVGLSGEQEIGHGQVDRGRVVVGISAPRHGHRRTIVFISRFAGALPVSIHLAPSRLSTAAFVGPGRRA